jgi:recombination protein RecT
VKCLESNHGKMTLLGALMESAQLGLEPGVLGSCWILPFWSSKNRCHEAQFVIGYRGMIDLARRSGAIKTLYANEVCENDELEMSYGVGGILKHKPNLRGPRGDVIGYYAFAELDGGGAYQYLYWPKESVEEHAAEHSETWGQDWSPWTQHFDAMAKKTMIRQLFKVLPVSVELQYAADRDEKVLVAEQRDDGLTIDVTEPKSSPLQQVDELPEGDPADDIEPDNYAHEGTALSESDIHGRTINALKRHGIRTTGDVAEHTQGIMGDDGAKLLAELDGVGPDGAAEVIAFTFPEEEDEVDPLIQEAREAYLNDDQEKASSLMAKMDDIEKAEFREWAKSVKTGGKQ